MMINILLTKASVGKYSKDKCSSELDFCGGEVTTHQAPITMTSTNCTILGSMYCCLYYCRGSSQVVRGPGHCCDMKGHADLVLAVTGWLSLYPATTTCGLTHSSLAASRYDSLLQHRHRHTTGHQPPCHDNLHYHRDTYHDTKRLSTVGGSEYYQRGIIVLASRVCGCHPVSIFWLRPYYRLLWTPLHA